MRTDRIGVAQVGIATALTDQDVLRLAVEADDCDVEMLSIEQESQLGPFGGRLSLVRLLLDEGRERLYLRPDRFVDPSVDEGSLTLRDRADREERGFAGLRGGDGGNRERAQEQKPS